MLGFPIIIQMSQDKCYSQNHMIEELCANTGSLKCNPQTKQQRYYLAFYDSINCLMGGVQMSGLRELNGQIEKKQGGLCWSWKAEKKVSRKNNNFFLENTAPENMSSSTYTIRENKKELGEGRVGAEQSPIWALNVVVQGYDWGQKENVHGAIITSRYVRLLKNNVL